MTGIDTGGWKRTARFFFGGSGAGPSGAGASEAGSSEAGAAGSGAGAAGSSEAGSGAAGSGAAGSSEAGSSAGRLATRFFLGDSVSPGALGLLRLPVGCGVRVGNGGWHRFVNW